MKQLRFLEIDVKDGSMQNVTGMLLLFVICIDMVKKEFFQPVGHHFGKICNLLSWKSHSLKWKLWSEPNLNWNKKNVNITVDT